MGRVSCIEEAQGWRSEMDGNLWEEDIVDDEPSSAIDFDADATELVDGKVVGEAALAKKGKGAAGAVGSVAAVKKKTRRTKWVATGEEVVQAFEAITRVKYESPTRLMGESEVLLFGPALLKEREDVEDEQSSSRLNELSSRPLLLPFCSFFPSPPSFAPRLSLPIAPLRFAFILDHHRLFLGSLAGRNDLEDPVAFVRNRPSRGRDEPHQRTTPRRHGTAQREGRRCARGAGEAGSVDHRHGSRRVEEREEEGKGRGAPR
jgi:hypothetical protein